MKVEFVLCTFDDEHFKHKLSCLSVLEAAFDDYRNEVPDGFFSFTDDEVKRLEVGYDMSDRQARRLAQTARFALNGIIHRIQEYENSVPEDVKLNWRQEKQFVDDYYSGTQSPLYSKPLPSAPVEILELYHSGEYVKYGRALVEFYNK